MHIFFYYTIFFLFFKNIFRDLFNPNIKRHKKLMDLQESAGF